MVVVLDSPKGKIKAFLCNTESLTVKGMASGSKIKNAERRAILSTACSRPHKGASDHVWKVRGIAPGTDAPSYILGHSELHYDG